MKQRQWCVRGRQVLQLVLASRARWPAPAPMSFLLGRLRTPDWIDERRMETGGTQAIAIARNLAP